MELHTLALDFALDLPTVRAWPELQDLLRRGAPPNSAAWKLPALACEAVGGKPEWAAPPTAALACLQLSIILVDDLLDADPRGEHQRIGAPAAANFALALQAAGLEAITHSAAGRTTQLAALACLNQMMLTTALGQHWDAHNLADAESYWRLVQTKSAPFFSAALQVGALFGGAALETVEDLKQIGRLYGEMIQVHDDFNDAMAVPANPDWQHGRSSLPILFAQVVDHPDRARFVALCRTVTDPEALAEAQAILIRSGAISYCVYQLVNRYRRAEETLKNLPLANRAGLGALLDSQIEPVRKLFRAVGVTQPNGATAMAV